MHDFTLMGFTWDVRHAQRLVQGRKPNYIYALADAQPYLGFVVINTRHAKTVDLSRPIIGIRRAFGSARIVYTFPIDGWHRIYRAGREGLLSLPMHVLSVEEEHAIRTY